MATLIELAPGTTFGGDFRVVRLLGEGGMGAVYVVVQKSTATPRALKLMQRELVQDAEMRERFEQEARLGSRIASDHVVQVVGAGVDGDTGLPWLAMELLRGESLDDYLAERGHLPPGEVSFLTEQLCHALGAAHDKGVVHRDLKPANIFLCAPRVVGLAYMVKVLDFGIAKVLAEARTTRTAAVGTPLYMAPEQYQAGRVAPATDVWALGLIAFELLTGRSYWKAAAGADATPAKLMYETCMGELGPPSRRAEELGLALALPEGFDAWFARAVCREPEGRFANAREAFAALRGVLGPAEPPARPLPLPPEEDLDVADLSGSGATVRAGSADGAAGTEAAEPAPRGGTVVERPADGGLTERASAVPTQKSFTSSGPGKAPGRSRAVLAIVAAGVVAAVVAVGIAAGDRTSASAVADTQAAPVPASDTAGAPASSSAVGARAIAATFHADGVVSLDGRLAHAAAAPGQRLETHVMLELRGQDAAPHARVPVHLGLVIDRSGSMAGERLKNAVAAAVSAVSRLSDGDYVSVCAFDTQVLRLVPPTLLGPESRSRVVEAIERLTLGGDTCISCGLGAALADLATTSGHVGRILLLSDGAANAGVRDEAGFGKLGRDAQQASISISTIGVGIDYNERILSVIARESSGRHYYADSEAALGKIFDAESQAMGGVVATQAEVRLELAPGVELLEVYDRTHRVEGARVVVPLGPFPQKELKTVLVKVALTPAASGATPVCRATVTYRGEIEGAPGETGGELALRAESGASPEETDPVVEVRVQRSLTARALVKSNALFTGGKPAEADRELAAQQQRLEGVRADWARRTLTPDVALASDLEDQQKAVAGARGRYQAAAARHPPSAAATSTEAREAVRVNAYRAYDMGL